MFNIGMLYKSDSYLLFSKANKNKILFANEVDSSTKAWPKKNFLYSPLGVRG